MLSLIALWESWHREAGKEAWLAAASLCYGLAVGARPTLLFGAVILLVPVWTAFTAHRRGEPVPSWRRLLPAAVLPIAAVGGGLAAFNFLRFGDPLQFGHEYQLSGNNVYGTRSFGFGFFWDNVRLYFLEPLRWHAGFPYVWRPATPPLTAGHLPVEFFYGTFINTPILLAACLLLLSLRRILPGREVTGPASVAIVLFAATALPICFYAGATSRYLVDFIPVLALLAAVGFFAAEASAVRVPEVPASGAARALAPVLRAALLYSVAVSWLLAAALSMFYRGAEEGTHLLNTGNIDQGAAILARMCRIDPDYAGSAELTVGSAYLRRGQPERAEVVLRAAVANSPGLGAAHYALGQALLTEGQFEAAADSLRVALRLDPGDAAAEANLGVALFRLGRIPEAIEHERAALDLDPSLADARNNLRVLESLQRR
jgi:tetratricopeptide (TPR) repeat protein